MMGGRFLLSNSLKSTAWTRSKALLVTRKPLYTRDPLWIYVDTMFLRTPEQRSVEKPGFNSNWRSEVVKCFRSSKIHDFF